MRVVHLSTTDFWEQGIGAYRIHKGLQEMGVESFMVTLLKSSGDPSVGMLLQDPVYKNRFKVTDRSPINIPTFFTEMLESWRDELGIKIMPWEGEVSYSLGNSPIDWSDIREVEEADIIHIHWTPAMLNFETIPLYFMKKPLIITCYDFFPLTGICHYPDECEKFTEGCKNCPIVYPTKSSMVEKVCQIKRSVYKLVNTFVVAQNKAMAETARLFFDKVNIIYPSSPFYEFSRTSKKKIRNILGIPQEMVVLISVTTSMANPRKGFDKILEIAEKINSRTKTYVILIGADMYELPKITSFPVHKIGVVPSEEVLSWYYTASDIFLLPADNKAFSLFPLDAMSMGLPVIAFEGGGMDDIIISGKNGYLIPRGDIELMIDRVLEISSSSKLFLSMQRAARDRIKRGFTMENQAQAYMSLYREAMLNKNKISISKLINWGEELFVNNKREVALKFFERLLEIEQENPDVLNNLGVIYWEEGRYQKAREYFKRAYEIAPDNPEIRENYEKTQK